MKYKLVTNIALGSASPATAWQTFYLSTVLVVAALGNILVAFTLLRRKLMRYPSNRCVRDTSDCPLSIRIKGYVR